MRLLTLSDTKDGIVLDFFAGSSTTAEAVLRMNRQDGGRRKFVLVQLPEPAEDRSTARLEGFDTISQIGKQRVRLTIDDLKSKKEGELPLVTAPSDDDLGFRVLKLAPSTYAQWAGVTQPTPDEYTAQMDAMTDPIVAGHDPEAVLWEVAIKEGFPLTSRVEAAAVHGHTVHRVTDPDTDRTFHICLDNDVEADLAAALQLTQDDLFVCRDIALTDTAAANLALQCRLKTI